MLKCECGGCNVCKSRERMRREREQHPERVRKRDRERYYRDRKKRRVAMDNYSREHPESVAQTKRQWIERNPEKRKAHVALGNAVRDGRVVKGACEVCGSTQRVHGHHDDYDKPLEVRWLCPSHHGELRRGVQT